MMATKKTPRVESPTGPTKKGRQANAAKKAAKADPVKKGRKANTAPPAPEMEEAKTEPAKTEQVKTEPVKPAGPGNKISALDAAARVLAETGQALTCTELIEKMAALGYWLSPGGKTPHSTLYAALLRELKTKGASARFQKTGRGQFALAPASDQA
jgi:HB1, ASXL, restriction endonuclease HTH domain